jgi:hypothetical protein
VSEATQDEAVYLGGRRPKKSDSEVGVFGVNWELDLTAAGEDGGDKLEECIDVNSWSIDRDVPSGVVLKLLPLSPIRSEESVGTGKYDLDFSASVSTTEI